MKYIIVTGGTASGIGKGIISASISYLLKQRDYKVAPIKFDGLLNMDFNSMNGYHQELSVLWGGEEVFVLEDGTEADLDIGVYERFIAQPLTSKNNIVNGGCWKELVTQQQNYKKGEIIKIRPHLLDIYQKKIEKGNKGSDVCVIEVGGTVGDDENRFFLDALARLKRINANNFVSIHVAYVPSRPNMNIRDVDVETFIDYSYILKPAKNSILDITHFGLCPDIVVCRSHVPLKESALKRISEATDIPLEDFVLDLDCKDIYEVPLNLKEQHIDEKLCKRLRLKKDYQKGHIEKYLSQLKNVSGGLDVVVIGNTESWDSYSSLNEALKHSGVEVGIKVNTKWVTSPTENLQSIISCADSVIITEGLENFDGKITAARYCRKKDVPLLGISAGAHILLQEFGEIKDREPLILEGPLFTGRKDTNIQPNSRLTKIYGSSVIRERHRLTGKINKKFLAKLEKEGLKILGICDGEVEAFEITPSKFIMGVQYHPEFTSRPGIPNPLLTEFIKYSWMNKNEA